MIGGNMKKSFNERFEDMDDAELLKCILAVADNEGCSDTMQELIDRNKAYWKEQIRGAILAL
jgi:hypothetical protein